MATMITSKERHPFIKNGILLTKDIPMLFKDKHFPWQYFNQFLTLLNKFEVALPLNDVCILIPSMLPDRRPAASESKKPKYNDLIYSRILIFSSADTPHGFWSRLLSWVVHSVQKVSAALEKATSANQSAMASFISDQQPSDNYSPKLLPNFSKQIPTGFTDSFDITEIQLECWCTGVYYEDPEVMFQVESLLENKVYMRGNKDGVLLTASANNAGKKIFCQLIDWLCHLLTSGTPVSLWVNMVLMA